MVRLTHFLYRFIPLAVLVLGICGLIYVTVQQNYRMDANDPQIQMAEDAATKLANGVDPSSVVPPQSIDISQSLAPFMMVFDSTGKVLASSGALNGHAPDLPDGVLADVKNNNQQIAVMGPTKTGELRFTWQPAPSVRQATVIVKYDGATSHGYVLAARNLREVEVRESNLTVMVGAGLLALLAAAAVAAYFL